MAEKALQLQHHVRESSQEVTSFLSDLNRWEKDIKKKDEDLKKTAAIEQLNIAPIRKKMEKTKKQKEAGKEEKSKANDVTQKARISAYDYDSWSKFDVDAACEEVQEKTENAEEDENDESEEEDLEAALEIEEQKRLQRAALEKDRGNDLFKEGKYEAAVNRYTMAAELDPTNAIIFANRAMALLKLERYAAAEVDCTKSLEIDPEYAKAIARRATARTKLKKLKEAKEDIEHLLLLQPNNKQATMDLEKLDKDLAKMENDTQNTQQPKKRSNKPLKRIIIEEVGDDFEDVSLPGNLANIQNVAAELRHPAGPRDQQMPGSQKETDALASDITTGKDLLSQREFQTPTSSVQFETDFRKVKKNPEVFYRYFSAIPTNMYKSLFHHSIDEVLPNAMECFHHYYKRDKKEYWSELSGLAEVPRFDMARMFLSKATKKVVNELFEELIQKNIDKKEEMLRIHELAKTYGASLPNNNV